MGGAASLVRVGIIYTFFICAGCVCNGRRWFDSRSFKCRTCTVCQPNYLTLIPCRNYRDTICLSLSDLEFNFLSGIKDMESVHPTHEVEFQGVTNWAPSYSNREADQTISQENGTNLMVFSLAIGCLLAITVLVVILIFVSCRLFKNRPSKRGRLATRARLFSRDRLTTSEYKNTLATLDRKLAMDEILEKKRAILAPSDDIKNNQYVDDVFVDLTASNLVDMEGTRLLRENC